MAGIRELIATVLGIALGVLFVLQPTFIVRIHTLGRGPHDRHGEFGSHEVDTKWLRLVQGVGVLLLLGGAYFGYNALLT